MLAVIFNSFHLYPKSGSSSLQVWREKRRKGRETKLELVWVEVKDRYECLRLLFPKYCGVSDLSAILPNQDNVKCRGV